MSAPTIRETHVKTATRMIDRHELARILGDIVAAEAGMPSANDPSISVKVDFRDETEGSPAYRVGTKALVTIEQNMACDEPKAGS